MTPFPNTVGQFQDLPELLAPLLARRQGRAPGEAGLVPAGVVVPLFKKDGVWHLLFTKRSATLPHHAGQFSFPGGVTEAKDADLLETALRETFEEVGVRPEDVTVLGRLASVVTRQGFHISPFVGTIPYPYAFRVSQREVALLLQVPLPALMDKRNVEIRREMRDRKMTAAYVYRYNGHIIWGATARIVEQFLSLVADISQRSDQ